MSPTLTDWTPTELLASRWEGELDDQGLGHWETPRANELLGMKRAGEGPDSLFDIVMAVARIAEDEDARPEPAFPGLAKYWYSPSGRKYTRRQVKAHYATTGCSGKPRRKRK